MKNTKKFLILLSFSVACAAAFLFFNHKKENTDTSDAIILTDSYSREAYLNLKGWDVSLVKSEKIYIPLSFEGSYQEYAQIQEKQKLPLKNYKGMEADRYVYSVNNYNGNRVVYAELLIVENRLVSGALIGMSPDSFIKELYWPIKNGRT